MVLGLAGEGIANNILLICDEWAIVAVMSKIEVARIHVSDPALG